MSTKQSVSIELVKFRGEYFPLDESSYHILRDYNVTVFRIPQQTLDLLKSTLLKKVKIIVYVWSAIYPELIKRFLSKLPKEGVQVKAEANWILIGINKNLDTDEIEAVERHVQTRCGQLQDMTGRYGIRISAKSKENDGFKLTKLVLTPDDSILPSFYFGVNPKAPITQHFYLSSTCRVEFTKKQAISGGNLMHIAFEDKLGDTWSQTVVRSFPISKITKSTVEETLAFFISLHSSL